MSPEATKSNCLVLLSFLLSQIGLQIEFVRCLFACFRGAGKEMKERERIKIRGIVEVWISNY